ncbi:mannitol dehydrogenase family protein [Aureimonas jatrophae]|uniref:Mannitol 2-dehydrogenase n=1 Tax=Aureimonas jatrophae TaxID=1166073 RepID=A0A1H0EQW7_9HYPH|nr:mannitol dehydrogenase family protein [Aureimonas jatrophae]MBB3950363.1 mannitol 2-dehydrogenase [Aureimonas jatrophae]SDN84699.1 mannitol 2-dehydrogenase [Aureimonas jatrophae]
MTALSQATLRDLSCRTPGYDRSRMGGGIVHFGVGNFHRAHQCVYLDDLFEAGGDLSWGITGVSVRAEDGAAFADMQAQDGLFTVTEVDEGHRQTRVVGSIHRLVDPGERPGILRALADPQTRIVSLTITEGGYYLSGDHPNLDHPDLLADAANLAEARTVFGLILAAIADRHASGAPPVTVLCCDNLPHNGDLTRRLVHGLAERVDAGLAAHVAQAIRFPNSMVDRITPATNRAQIESLAADGIEDRRPVFCEPFMQWVIEDTFSSGRPELERVGVTFVEDVTPYELMKLRILNAGHATIAYPAALIGLTYAHEAMRDDLVSRFFRDVEEGFLLPASPEIRGVSREDYLASVTHRFANPAIGDTIRRLCLDGSNRQPKFVLPAVRELLAQGRDVSGLALVSALWCRYCAGTLEDGSVVEPNDPNWDLLNRTALEARDNPSRFLELRDVFGDLGSDPVYAPLFSGFVRSLWEHGVAPTIEAYLRVRQNAR